MDRKVNSVNAKRLGVLEDRIEKIFIIPNIGLPSILCGRKLKQLFQEHYQIDIKIVFTTFKVKNYCRAPLPLIVGQCSI